MVDRFAVSVWTGASTAPELDGALAAVDGIDLRMPYQSDPVTRAKINAGLMDYLDMHLSHVAQMVWEGFFGHLDVALVEVAGITADGELIPSSSVGNNKTWIDQADRVILEVNSWQPDRTGGHARHLLRHRAAPAPQADPDHPRPADRIGVPYLHCPPEKIVAVVETHAPDRNTAVQAAGRRLAADRRARPGLPRPHEVARAGCRPTLLPLQSGVGNIANAVLAGLGRRAVPAADRLHRGDPGRHAAAAALGHDERRLGDRVLAQRGRHRRSTRQHRPTTATGSSCARRRSATTPRSSAGSAAWR